jgi:RNA polymerase sigma factor (TIGR02999 family)
MSDPTGSDAPGDVTQLLHELRRGRGEAFDELIPLVYEQLQQIARRRLGKERDDHTLRTTELVHEAYDRLVDHHAVDWNDRSHFFAVAARAMRQVLVEHARKKNAQKRGGDVPHVSVSEKMPSDQPPSVAILALHDALERLQALDARQARVVEGRFFAGLTIKETAQMLDVSPSTVKRDWRTARAWLAQELREGKGGVD